ncbi:hypothetical protein LOZ36_000939 [Ophidiomyces ophidiicola]|nr:hypothetical protein LOZ36_000939 [Ophidiomyces ophidiicola]
MALRELPPQRRLKFTPRHQASHRRATEQLCDWPLYARRKKSVGNNAAALRASDLDFFSKMEPRGDVSGWGVNANEDDREKGSRRRKVYGYLKAANELRQSYSAQWAQKTQIGQINRDMQNNLSDYEVSSSGHEEMILFPSYGRRHLKIQSTKHKQYDYDLEDSLDDEKMDRPPPQGMEYWESIWHRYENDNAIVDIDVRGWIYFPQRGQMTRKNRLLITLARKISGIPAPIQPSSVDDNSTGQENGSLEKQADLITRKQAEFEEPKMMTQLSQEEIATANAQLMDRLRPFLTSPAVGVPATIFFFNDIKSQSRTVITNEGGHFAIRASLDFIPTQIRVLASEHLSATEEVKVIEPNGVSLISDIDDTIKHSAIVSGAKEMFRNTFVRNLADLSILGVKEWYSQMANLGVGIHYVSNSPWQLYSLLKNYFTLTGLPPGSMHLKQYSGMLQGIFEPTADRKRPTLERIIQDFPDRQFILVGDSGEVDLEIYTELAIANPGRILGIFIRDVTTLTTSNFFDKSISRLEKASSRNMSSNIPENLLDVAERRPPLPPRKPLQQDDVAEGILIGDLIDLEEQETRKPVLHDSTKAPPINKSEPPPPPSKPTKLRGEFIATSSKSNNPVPIIRKKPVPPPPAKPRALSLGKTTPSTETTTVPFFAHSHPTSPCPSTTRLLPPVPPPRRGAASSLPKALPVSTYPSSSVLSYSEMLRPSPNHHENPPSLPALISEPQIQTPSESSLANSPIQLPSKREEAWQRRWARAREILVPRGVALHSWRVGEDVREICIRLVKQAHHGLKQQGTGR